jgi:hypothetical protein
VASWAGSTSFAILKIAAVLTGIGAAVLAIAVWSSAQEPQVGFDAFGQLTVTRESSGVKVAAGFAVLIVGLVQAALLWAVASIGEHLIAIRSGSGSAPVAVAHQPSAPPSPGAAAVAAFELRITNPGKRPDKTVKMLHETFGVDRETAEAAARGERTVTGGYATVEGARMSIASDGGSADVTELD